MDSFFSSRWGNSAFHCRGNSGCHLQEDSGKYVVLLKGDPEEIGPIPVKDPNNSPQGPVYAKKDDLLRVKVLDEAIK
jgi:hypothetical protein